MFTTVDFGKHKGKPWSEVPDSYLEWALGEFEDGPRKRRVQEEISRRMSETGAASSEVIQLAKILGMLGSEHDGEVISAARRAEEARKRMGHTWQQLLQAA